MGDEHFLNGGFAPLVTGLVTGLVAVRSLYMSYRRTL